MTINETIKKAHGTAVEKGFWDKPEWNLGEKLMLVTSELGEALEADRTGKYAKKESYEIDLAAANKKFNDNASAQNIFGREDDPLTDDDIQLYNDKIAAFKNNLKDSFEDEMADAIIRLFDLAGKMNIDLEYHIRLKMEYNATRDKLHGKKY